jgi:hypothetical protein
VGRSEQTPGASPFSADQQQQVAQQQVQQQQQEQPQATLSPSPSLYNITAANVIAQQPSQSLQRLLSGTARGRRAASLTPRQQQSATSIPSPLPVSAPLTAANSSEFVSNAHGELPIVQLQPSGVVAMISEADTDMDDEEGTCEICFDAAAVVALQQCGHTLCVCCCKELCKLHHFKPGLCPYCR